MSTLDSKTPDLFVVYQHTDEDLCAARKQVAKYSRDPDDESYLLDVLGLT